MGRVDGRVAFITGAGRGQGRSHAIRLAEEGADIVAVDSCDSIETVDYPLATADDMAETVRLVEQLDRRIIFKQADVRDLSALQDVVDLGLEEFGHIDIVCANAGIVSVGTAWELTEDAWQTMLDVNLTGVWKTVKAVVPSMIRAGRGGSIILTSSLAGVIAFPNIAHYTAAKHGVTGLMRSLAVDLGPYNIRVNSLHPSNVDTEQIQNPTMRRLISGADNASREDVIPRMMAMHALPIPWADPRDISNAVLWLASDESRCVTGTTQLIDCGGSAPFKVSHDKAH